MPDVDPADLDGQTAELAAGGSAKEFAAADGNGVDARLLGLDDAGNGDPPANGTESGEGDYSAETTVVGDGSYVGPGDAPNPDPSQVVAPEHIPSQQLSDEPGSDSGNVPIWGAPEHFGDIREAFEESVKGLERSSDEGADQNFNYGNYSPSEEADGPDENINYGHYGASDGDVAGSYADPDQSSPLDFGGYSLPDQTDGPDENFSYGAAATDPPEDDLVVN